MCLTGRYIIQLQSNRFESAGGSPVRDRDKKHAYYTIVTTQLWHTSQSAVFQPWKKRKKVTAEGRGGGWGGGVVVEVTPLLPKHYASGYSSLKNQRKD